MRRTGPTAEEATPPARSGGEDGGEGFTSREAAWLSDVPFFTVDSWGRTGFLRPSVFKGAGRGRGRERRYGFADVLRLRIARSLREQGVSVATLRSLLDTLKQVDRELETARYVVVHERAICIRNQKDLAHILTRPETPALSLVLDMREILAFVSDRGRALDSERRRHAVLMGRHSRDGD